MRERQNELNKGEIIFKEFIMSIKQNYGTRTPEKQTVLKTQSKHQRTQNHFTSVKRNIYSKATSIQSFNEHFALLKSKIMNKFVKRNTSDRKY